MKKIIAMCVGTAMAVVAHAVPAHPGMVTITQPDGNKVTVRLVGDEFFNYNCTSDGYTVVRNEQGDYEYATLNNGRLEPSGLLAHDMTARTADERQFLSVIGKHLRSEVAVQTARAQRTQRDRLLAPRKAGTWDNYRGLVILVNLQNKTFKRTDAQAFYQDQTNKRNYTGYQEQNSSQWVNCTGSVRDYFYDNSMGKFDPQFDVIGPVTANYNTTSFSQTANARTIFLSVLEQVKSQVDFSQYDADGNGVVDMVYFIVAGYGSNYEGNTSSYLWPHASSFAGSGVSYNGKTLGRYACSVEMDGLEYYGGYYATIGGIGTMCHEFSHVLGVMDHYDTDYSGSGGQSNTPGEWDVMAGGSYFNSGRTPCGYTLFERYTMGFANPTVITEPGDYTLNPVNTSNEGYIIKSPIAREYFMLDNRQKTRWDAYIPGHGMLVWRVDSTNSGVWANNAVNANPEHNYLEIIRAGQASSASASDPFPGSRSVRSLDANTNPALLTWGKFPTELGLKNIFESNKVITFTVFQQDGAKSVIEDFEHMPTSTTGNAADVMGYYANWTFYKSNVVIAPDTACTGRKAVAMVSPSYFYMTTELPTKPHLLTFHAYNYTNVAAKVRVEYKSATDTKWTTFKALDVPAGADQVAEWQISLDAQKMWRFSQPTGNKTVPIYVDDITFHYMGNEIPTNEFPDDPVGDVNGDGMVDVADVNLIINIMLGQMASTDMADVDGNGTIDVADVNTVINLMLGK